MKPDLRAWLLVNLIRAIWVYTLYSVATSFTQGDMLPVYIGIGGSVLALRTHLLRQAKAAELGNYLELLRQLQEGEISNEEFQNRVHGRD